MPSYILTHDLGTSGNKASLFGLDGSLKAFCVEEYGTYYPAPGHVEQKAADWWAAVCKSSVRLLADSGVSASQIACVSFSGQMMGCVLVDGQGELLRDAIIWADSRSVTQEAFLRRQIDPWLFYEITGHRPAAFYSLCKLLWLRDNEPDIFRKADKMLLAKDYIIYRLTGEFVTDYSDAGGTNCFDIRKKIWSPEILDAVSLNPALLPRLTTSLDIVGQVTDVAARATGLLAGTPVVIGGGDGSCAAAGAGCVREGSAYVVIGSSSWIARAAKAPVFEPGMKTFNWVALDPDYYTPCGTMQAAGYSLSWLKDTLCDMENAEATKKQADVYGLINETLASSPPGAGGVLFLPYLLGERSPRWNAQARAAFLGLSMTSTKADMIRSVFEGVGYNLKVILDLIDRKQAADKIIAIGGGAKNNAWLQILADIWQTPLETRRFLEEATSIGAAICAGVAIGAFTDFSVIDRFNPADKIITPDTKNAAIHEKMYDLFNEVYDALEGSFLRG